MIIVIAVIVTALILFSLKESATFSYATADSRDKAYSGDNAGHKTARTMGYVDLSEKFNAKNAAYILSYDDVRLLASAKSVNSAPTSKQRLAYAADLYELSCGNAKYVLVSLGSPHALNAAGMYGAAGFELVTPQDADAATYSCNCLDASAQNAFKNYTAKRGKAPDVVAGFLALEGKSYRVYSFKAHVTDADGKVTTLDGNLTVTFCYTVDKFSPAWEREVVEYYKQKLTAAQAV